jgi:hypothetical protein
VKRDEIKCLHRLKIVRHGGCGKSDCTRIEDRDSPFRAPVNLFRAPLLTFEPQGPGGARKFGRRGCPRIDRRLSFAAVPEEIRAILSNCTTHDYTYFGFGQF